MTCKEFTSKIDAYLRGELPETEQEHFEEHYFGCDACFITLKISERLQSKTIRIPSAQKKRHLVFKPAFVLPLLTVLILTSSIMIFKSSKARFLYRISTFTPPAYVTSETRNLDEGKYIKSAMGYYQTKDYTSALKILQEIPDTPPNFQIVFFRGICYLLTDKLNDAIREFDTIIERMDPSYYDEAMYYKSIALLRDGKIRDAENNLKTLGDMFSPLASKAEHLLKKIPADR